MDDTNTKWILQRLFLSLSVLVAVNAFIAPGAAIMPGPQDNSDEIAADVAQALVASEGQAKNVILLIGDGMGANQVEAARWEKAGHSPTAYRTTTLAMDGLTYRGTISTRSADNAVTDSAAAATALMTGTRTDNGVIGEDATAVHGVSDGAWLETIAELAEETGRSTGAVTTTRITHATPAGTYAHVNDRDNELLIARQFIDSDLDVALGGGYRQFIPTTTTDPWSLSGLRTDGRNLVTEAKGQGYTVVSSASALSAVSATSTTKVLGLFASSAMAYERSRGTSQPSLSAMTGKALSVLATDPDGFFLMVEGGNIDPAATDNDYTTMTGEVLAFDEAVKTAIAFAGTHPDTLVIVTADHETGGLTLKTNADGSLTFTFTASGHTAADVPIRASGPGAERFSGILVPNTQVFTVMEDAMGTTAPAPLQTPFNGTHVVPGRVEAEDYDNGGAGIAYYDTTPGNTGGAGRLNEDVDVRLINGITDIAYIGPGEWTEYTVTAATAGEYTANFRVGTNRDGGQLVMTVDDAPGCTVTVPNTGSYTAYQTVAAPLTLTQGTHVIRLTYVTGYTAIDWFEIIPATAPVTLPIAGFSASPTSGTAPLAVTFTDASTGNPTAWAWDFTNDGVIDSTVQNPTYTYPTAGTYTVKLTATNTAGSDADIKTNFITVSSAPQTATITFTSVPAGGRLYLDGVSKGVTPITIPGITFGDHLIEIRLNRYAKWTDSITVTPGYSSYNAVLSRR